MKIDSPKTFRLPERKEPTVAAPQPQGTLGTSKRLPSDGFVPPRPSGNKPPVLGGPPPSGGTPPPAQTATPHFDMPTQLEPFRGLFSRIGERIANNPRLQDPALAQRAIERAAARIANRLPKDVGVGVDVIRDTLDRAVAAFRRGGPDIDDEQFGCRYASDAILDRSPKLQEKKPALQQIAFPIASNSAFKSVADILKESRPQVEALGLQGREKAQANRYVVSLVKELRAREAAANPPALPVKRPAPLDTGDWRKNLQWKP